MNEVLFGVVHGGFSWHPQIRCVLQFHNLIFAEDVDQILTLFFACRRIFFVSQHCYKYCRTFCMEPETFSRSRKKAARIRPYTTSLDSVSCRVWISYHLPRPNMGHFFVKLMLAFHQGGTNDIQLLFRLGQLHFRFNKLVVLVGQLLVSLLELTILKL